MNFSSSKEALTDVIRTIWPASLCSYHTTTITTTASASGTAPSIDG